MYDVVKKEEFSMKKYISILFVSAIVLSGVLFAPSASTSASQKNSSQISAITGNHSFETANPVGYWKYKNIDTAILPEGKKIRTSLSRQIREKDSMSGAQQEVNTRE